LFLGPLISLAGSKRMSLLAWKPNNKEDLDFIKELIESGKLVPVIDRRYPLNEVVEAFRYFEEGYPQGKIVITMEHNNKT
jgi:NADPH:quinone reductase-like Zn-dependent oxidoreductase